MKTDDNKVYLMLAYLCVATEAEASLPRKVQILDRFNLSDKDIATVCSTTAQVVRNARLTLKKKWHGKQ